MSRALLYADWCCVRHALRSSAKSCALAMVLAASVSLLGADASIYNIDATGFIGALSGILVSLGAMAIIPRLFYADEQGGWGEFRLALPVTRPQAVGSRFALVAVIVVVVAVASLCLGMLVVLATRLLPQAFGVWTVDGSLPLQATLVALVLLAMAGPQMAVYFAVGVERGRFATMIPVLGAALAFLVLTRIGVTGEGGILSWLASVSPEVLVVMAVAACLAVYLLSLMVARRAFARREF